MSWPSFFSLYHQPHQCITSVLSCLLSCWEHFSLPCPAIPQVLFCHFLSETVNTCSPSSGDPEQFSPPNPQHVLCNVLVGPQSISAWRDFCGLPHCTDKPSGMERGHPSLTITHVCISPPQCEWLNRFPFGTLSSSLWSPSHLHPNTSFLLQRACHIPDGKTPRPKVNFISTSW